MRAERRNAIVLAALAAVLVAVVVYQLRFSPAAGGDLGSGAAAGRDRQARNAAAPPAPDVHLDALKADRPKPDAAERNPFRFKPKPPPPPPPSRTPPAGTTGGPEAARPAGPPPPPAISSTLKFIGIVEAPERSQRVAVLSDGRHVYYGREGETVLGQYRILRIGAESIEMAYLDGRGRQAIRLSGS